MLSTNLKHVETEEELNGLLKENENVMLSCGRMGPMCIPVYNIMEQIESKYPHVAFMDMDFDIRTAVHIRRLPECSSFMGLPFTIYFKNGKVAAATSSIQNLEQITEILNREFVEG